MAVTSTLTVTHEDAGMRLDRALRAWYPQLNFGAVQKLCRTGQVRLNGKRVKGNERLEEGHEVRIPPQLQNSITGGTEEGTKITLTMAERGALKDAILYQDEHIIAVNKPAGLPVQAGSGHQKSMDRLLEAYFPDQKPRLVHRLDKGTTGVLLFAFNREGAAALSQSFANHEIRKTYWAVVKGALLESAGHFDFDLEKMMEGGREVVQARKKGTGQEALTEYTRLQRFTQGTQLVEVHPKTGRTHQIRAHFSAVGCPLVGDKKYGGDSYVYKGKGYMLLHAKELRFTHPITGVDMHISAPLPDVFSNYLEKIAIKRK